MMLNIAAFWLVGQGIWLLLRGKYTGNPIMPIKTFIAKHQSVLLLLLWAAILAGTVQFVQFVSTSGIQAISTRAFETTYGYGVPGHLVSWAYPSFILLGASFFVSKKKTVALSLLLMAAVMLVGQVKYHLILALLAAFYFTIQSRVVRGLSSKYLIGIGAAIALAFFGAYWINFSARSGPTAAFESSGALVKHAERYLVGGPIALDYILHNFEYALPWQAIATVPINVYRWLCGNHNLCSFTGGPGFIATGTTSMTNVGTMFGSLYMFLGYQGAILFMMFLGAITYAIFNLALKGKGVILTLLSSWMLSVLTLSFFGFYFTLLRIWEVAAAIIIIPIAAVIVRQIFNPSYLKGY